MEFLPALGLSERVPLVPTGSPPVSQRARWRLARWRDLPAFGTEEAWRRRLDADACDEDVLLRLLDEPAEAIAVRLADQPRWAQRLSQLYSAPAVAWSPDATPGRPLDDALIIAAPILADARRRVREAAPSLNPETLGYTGLLDDMVRLLSRACVLELNVARLQGNLPGDTPAQRFAAFFARLADPAAALEFLAEYPVLARRLLTVADAWVSATVELLRRLDRDWEALVPAFGIHHRATLTGFTPGGDAHHGGRRVGVATFSDGSRVVYKPRDLGLDSRFQSLLRWLDRIDGDLAARTFEVLPRDGYGWTEFIAAAAPTSPARYARRYGKLLALLYLVGASDCHAENVIGAGDSPVLVDLETLFTPALARGAGLDAGELIASSVLAVSLLPAPVPETAEGAACHCSHWLGAGTDEMHLHVPGVHIGHAAPPPAVSLDADEVIAGFRHTYDLLHRNVGLLGDWVRTFAGHEIRVVLRPTRTYTKLQDALLHTDHLRDALDRDRLLDWLWAGVDELPALAMTIAAERAALAEGDVPRFTSLAGSLDLHTGDGGRVPGALAASGITEAARRLAAMGDADRERQVWLIRAHFASLRPAAGSPQGVVRWRPSPMIAPQHLLEHAGELAERIAAMRHGEAGWFTFGPAGPARWAPVPMGPGLYDGLSGLALFFGYAGHLTHTRSFTGIAERVAARLAQRLRDGAFATAPIGAFNGWAGIAYAFGHLDALWGGDRAVRSTVDLALTRMELLAGAAPGTDVVDGLAGAILATLAIAGRDSAADRSRPDAAADRADHEGGTGRGTGTDRARPDAADRAIGLAQRLGDRLIALGPAASGLGGFSHGTAGVAAALTRLWAVTGDGRYAEAGRQALDFDRGLFRPASANWADLRQDGIFSMNWCHGAPGIGLSRVLIREALNVEGIDEEIQIALRTTLARGFGRNHSLCHGDLGNLELPLLLGGESGDFADITAGILHDAREHGWQCANPHGIESPELMTGLSGMGYQLLRLASPHSVPSLLTLAGPR